MVFFRIPLSTFHSRNLALSLFMFGVFTDNPDHPFSFYNLTLVADFFDRSSNFHCLYPIVGEVGFRLSNLPAPFVKGAGRIVYFSRKIILPRERS